ncbi:hypothetical protein ACIQXW_06175 [Lysinibacillus sp. NPDC097162]|uniref:hypothetical protein n=1 Tax=Lysinibacillus sp. NPDC097162 TaxID=3364140 RepID=UPI003812EBFE
MDRKVKGRYILFQNLLVWGKLISLLTLIYRKLNIHKVSAAIIAIDLELLGVIKPRKHGLIGKRLDGDYDDWFEEFKKDKELVLYSS